MKTNSTSRAAFFNSRLLIGFALCSASLLLVLAGLSKSVTGMIAAAPDPNAQDKQDHHHNHVRYSVTDLGTLGGTFSTANGINNRGLVTGFSSPPSDSVVHVFLWRRSVMTDLGTLGGPNSFTPDQNHLVSEKGAVVGFADTSTPDPNGEDACGDGNNLICLPFVWQKGVMTALPLLGGNNGQANGINNRGQIVGVSETPNPDSCSIFFLQVEAAIWENGQVQELPPFPGDPDGNALAINDNGEAVGVTGCVTGNTHAVLWPNGPNGGVIDLGNLGGRGGGTTGNIAFDINNQGQVVGQSNLPGDTTHHAFLWQNGVMTDLGTILGLPVSLANGINNKGQVVGFSQDMNNNNTVAWLWQNGVMTDLNTLIPADSPLFLIEALGINDRGQIAGPAFNASTGDFHGFLLTPCDEENGDGEGCDDSLVDASAAPAARPAVREASGPMPTASLWRRNNRFHFPAFSPRN
jgi:probable HAF family extracellular repeat protein